MQQSFHKRMEALEALSAAQRPEAPPYVCMHTTDYAVMTDLATPIEVRMVIADAYGLGGDRQKVYVGLCHCDAPETCRVCDDRPVIGELL